MWASSKSPRYSSAPRAAGFSKWTTVGTPPSRWNSTRQWFRRGLYAWVAAFPPWRPTAATAEGAEGGGPLQRLRSATIHNLGASGGRAGGRDLGVNGRAAGPGGNFRGRPGRPRIKLMGHAPVPVHHRPNGFRDWSTGRTSQR